MRLQFDIGNFNISRLIYSSATSTKDLISIELDKLYIYPNPASDLIYVSNLTQTVNFQIINLSGQIVKSGELHVDGYIDIDNLNYGHYFIRLTNNNLSQTIKFIKN